MLKSEILEKLHKKHSNLSSEDIELLLSIFIKKIINSLKNGNNIEIRGLGRWYNKKLKANPNLRNPATNELIYRPERVKVKFKAFKKLNKLINE